MTALGQTETIAAAILTRGGGAKLCGVPITACNWDRRFSDVSEFSTTSAKGMDCSVLGRLDPPLRPWSHYLAIFRNNKQIIQGPITAIDTTNGVLIKARTPMVWASRRKIHRDIKITLKGSEKNKRDLFDIFKMVIDDAMSVDDVPGLHVEGKALGITGERDILVSDYQYASHHLDELARNGLAWIERPGGEVFVHNFDKPSDPIAHLVAAHFVEEPDALIDGGPYGTEFTVIGETKEDDDPDTKDEKKDIIAVAKAGDVALFGVHEQLSSEPEIMDQKSCDQAAKTRAGLFGEPYLTFTGGQLKWNAPVDLEMLYPGAAVRCSTSSSCVVFNDIFRIRKIVGSHGPKADSISIEVEPFGNVEVPALVG